jgi:amidase
MASKWEQIGASKRQQLLDSIPKEWLIPADIRPADSQSNVLDFPERSGLFMAKEIEMTNTSATDLLRKLARGEWSSEEVTRAFCKRASVAHQLVRQSRSLS